MSSTKFVFFLADRKNKMAALASDWLRHFWLLFWNFWTEFNDIWQEARHQRPLPSLCFSGRSEKTRWPPWPLIGWYIFDLCPETAERNSMKIDRKQDLSQLPLPILCFRPDRINKLAARPLFGWDIFDCSPETAEWNSTKLGLLGIKISTSSTNFVFFGPIGKNKTALASDWLRHYRLLVWNHWSEFNATRQEARS